MKVNIGKYKKDGSPRKTKITIDKWDVWSLDSTLAKIIHPSLVEFKKNIHSYPPEFENIEEWKNVINKMIFSFKAIKNDDKRLYNNKNEFHTRIQEGLVLFGKYYLSLWD